MDERAILILEMVQGASRCSKLSWNSSLIRLELRLDLNNQIVMLWTGPSCSSVKNLPATQERWVRSPGQEDPLEKGMATHSSILAWRIPWTEEPGGL